MTAVVIPSVGIAMEEALVLRWLKQPGEEVAVDEPILEIETDKATMDVVSPAAGTLGPHLIAEGAVVPVGTAVVHVLDGRESAADATGQPQDASTSETEAANAGSAAQVPVAGEERQGHRLSPRARRIAREQEEAQQPEPPASAGRFRELIATKVLESWREIPHYAVTREVGAGALLETLEALRSQGVNPQPTLTDLLLRSLALGLAERGTAGAVDVGLAVASDSGVLIPVVRDVLALSPGGLALARSAAVARGRGGRLDADDLGSPASSTLSNLGAFGVDSFTGIIASGQTTLLTVGRASARPFVDERGALTVATRFQATLNADHRTIDGADAARLLGAFAAAAEGMTPASWERSA